MCEIMLQRSKTHSANQCSRNATFVAETVIDGKTTQIKCCAQHKSKAVDSLIKFSNGSKLFSIINTHVKIENIHKPSMVEYFSEGTVEFGPETKSDVVSQMLRQCEGELFYLEEMCEYPYQDDWEKEMYRSRYIQCAKKFDCFKNWETEY